MMQPNLLQGHGPVPSGGLVRLRNFGIRGFRAFRRLEVPRLGRVNLFVGMNNVGKTSILEALQLYATAGAPSSIIELLTARDEITLRGLRRARESVDLMDSAISRLFHEDGNASEAALELGPLNRPMEVVRLARGWAKLSGEDEDDPQLSFSLLQVADLFGEQRRALQISVGSQERRVLPYDRFALGFRTIRWEHLLPSTFVSAYGLSSAQIGDYWDRIALTDAEEYVLSALQIVAPKVERLSLVGDIEGTGERRVVVRTRGRKMPVPLRSMGDGMNRLLSLSLSLVNSVGGVLLLDEVENGIHYSVQTSMWKMIFDLAAHLDVQVFASTHSWDCIRAFALAANDRRDSEGLLYRLESRNDDLRAVEFSEEDLAIVTRQRVEVR